MILISPTHDKQDDQKLESRYTNRGQAEIAKVSRIEA
jgi:hypothetical protein